MTAAAESASPLERITYQDLYARWERANWRSTELDFGEDREHWTERFDDAERRSAIWNYALFFAGEDRVAQDLTAYIDAAPTEEQKYFLATQQVDEARHAIFFSRFFHEVCGYGDGTIAAGLAAIGAELSWGHRGIFARLERMRDELRADRSIPRLAQAITLYHVVIEATLAQPGQHWIERYLAERNVLPAFRAGMANISQDEQRHIGFGVKILSDLRRQDPEVPHAVAELLREITPFVAAFGVPPGWDTRYYAVFGSTLEHIVANALESLETKLRSAGLPLDELPGPAVIPLPTRSRAERADAAVRLTRAGYVGERNGPASRTPADVALLFDVVADALGAGAAPPGILQLEFSDAEPWHLRFADGGSGAAPGRAASPTLTLRCAFDDWVDLVARRADPRRMVLQGRLRPRGDLRWLWRARDAFARPAGPGHGIGRLRRSRLAGDARPVRSPA